MTPTPEIPRWIRTFRHPGYTNVFSFLPDCPRLYGTETLFGDWDAPVLLLAKDGAPTHVIRDLARTEGAGAWRHAQRARGDVGGWRTNERLAQLASILPGSKLYGSATANMLYDDPGWSRTLPGVLDGPLHEYLIRVLAWVMDSMPNLRAVACLGREAWHLTSTVMGNPEAARDWEARRDSCRHLSTRVERRQIIASALYHPAARVSVESMQVGWEALAGAMQIRRTGFLRSLLGLRSF